jgi:WD40 repeat protein
MNCRRSVAAICVALLCGPAWPVGAIAVPPRLRDVFRGGHADRVLAVAFSPDRKNIASAGADNLVKLWDVATGANSADLRGHQSRLFAVAFRPDGKALATGSLDDTIRLWDVASRANAGTIAAGSKGVEALAFRPDGKVLPRRDATASSSSGTRPLAVAPRTSGGMRSPSWPWPSVPTAGDWPRAASTTPSGSGM